MALVLTSYEVHAKLLGESNGERSKIFELEADSGAVDDNARDAVARSQTIAMITSFKLLTGAVVTSFSIRAIHEEDGAVTIPTDANVYKEAFLTVGVNTSGTKKETIAYLHLQTACMSTMTKRQALLMSRILKR